MAAAIATAIGPALEFFYLMKKFMDHWRGGEEVVRRIEYELETLIPRLEWIELSRQIESSTGHTRDVIRRAEDLAETYTKRVIKSKAANYRNPINSIGKVIITKKLHKIRDEIDDARGELSILSTHEEVRAAEPSLFLPSYLRRCIHYFLLFPADYEVPARRLIALWIAEGLVRSKKQDHQSSVEKIAEGYLDELIQRKEIHATTNRRTGKVKTCKIDAGRRNELLEEAEMDNFLQDSNGNGKIRRLVDHNHNHNGGHDSFIQIDGDTKVFDYRDVISFLSFNTEEGSKPGDDIGDFLRKCISKGCFEWLRVLDLERVFRPQLPDALGKMIAVKYLGLRWTYLEKLPATIDGLFNLQVLDVKHTYISVLPRSIWTMEYLRHLYLSEVYRTRFPDPPSRVTLTTLQTLWGAFVDEDTCIRQGLDRLLNIRKLGLSCRWRPSKMSEQLTAIDEWISNLKFLESLRLKSRDENGNAADLHLSSLEGNKNLSTVYLLGKLEPLILCELPVSLTDITLSGSALDLDPMPFLGSLPNLVILRLLGESVVCKNMYCYRRGFPRLKLLWLWKLEKLEELEAEEGSLPCLEELEIRSCKILRKLPDPLVRLQNLEIKLTRMPPEFEEEAEREGKFAHVKLIRNDDLVSPSSVGDQHSISRNNTPQSTFR
ncbi:hypothetical protein C2S53_012263 [Perilla frutescens var. hirtella]|uniref:Uncharacterized protein n=1 Tax=Perilla frutescens var. hirtella TaxID=608512 RepID=A0AAD4P588_PERFH|nr:hypothetical protein C2S53_012263 [Perilla frutescens var. hirtella]